MKRKIKIQPINVPGQDSPIVVEMNDTDLFYLKSKKIVADTLKGISQDEFVFYSKSKSIIVHEDDRVQKICSNKDVNEIDLYLTSDLIKKVLQGDLGRGGGQIYKAASQIMDQNQDKISKLENEIKDLKSEILKLQNTLRIEKNDFNNQVTDYQEQIQELKNQEKSQKQQFDIKIKQEEEQRAETIQKYKDMMNVNTNLKNENMQKDNQIEELMYQLKVAEAEKKFNEDQLIRENEGKQKSTYSNDNEIQQFRQQILNLQRIQNEDQFERKKDKEIISQLQKQIQEYKNNLQQKNEELIQTRSRAEQEISSLKEELKKSEERCQSYKDMVIKQKKDMSDQTNNYLELKTQFNKVQVELNFQIQKVEKLEGQIKELYQEIEIKDFDLKNIKNSKEVQLDKMDKSEKEQQNKIYELENELKIITEDRRRIKDQLQEEIDKKTIEIQKLTNELQNLVEQSKQDMQKCNQEFQNLFHQLEIETEKQKAEENKRAQLIKRIKENALRKVGDGKIISPTEAVFKNMSDPFEFLKNQNTMTNDLTVEVEILRVDTNEALKSLIKNQEPNLAQFIKREPIGNWKIKRSLGISGHGTKRKGFLMQVVGSQGLRYNQQVFLMKELTGFERIVTVEKAFYVAQNSLIAMILAEHFQFLIYKAASEKPPCKFSYKEPFLLQADGNFYIAERLIKGAFIKFNGEGETMDKNENIANYFNAFSLFTYVYTQKMLMVSNIQGNFNGTEYILCDPIISSPEGIMGDEDLAEPHILQFQDNFKENPKKYGKNYLSSLQIKI